MLTENVPCGFGVLVCLSCRVVMRRQVLYLDAEVLSNVALSFGLVFGLLGVVMFVLYVI